MKRAFTLIELLVIIVIISVLATMFLPVISKSKEHSKTINCINNLRQVMIGILIYVEDTDYYPLLVTYTNHNYFQSYPWYKRISFYINQENVNSLICPSTEKFYGYNSSGCGGWNETNKKLGLGGIIIPNPFTYPNDDTMIGIKSSTVKYPSQMISIGDSVIHYNFVGEYYYSSIDLSSGLWWVRLYNTANENSHIYLINGKKAIIKRHNNRVNVSFCDGHVEKIKPLNIFNIDNENNLKKWNNDNLSHFEEYYPSLKL